MFQFTIEQEQQFDDFLRERNRQNWGLWPASETWPQLPGMPDYSLNQYDGPTTVAKFDQAIRLADGRSARKVGVGKTRRMNGVLSLERSPATQARAVRSPTTARDLFPSESQCA